ncbi:Trm112 family protein [bacterium endosymbiont of Pedicinus badii]|uniref:Trm112 family protein n=1 Tax=bacterium endosymbiont of Pedicinus badii TaxID=1719126 RepID=UPI0009BBF471|nr:Trm112 family protein [bacterium endosymbiont of Pedicinus badii]OQM34349.1 hypothetical protein AOQ89_00420 [bacterium endosymbiont of Pedicinus badii]
MDSFLLNILVCPICKSALTISKNRKELICKKEKLAFPIKQKIPILLKNKTRKITKKEKSNEI